jgi:hypothetical protein
VALQVRPELAKYVESNVGAHHDAKADGAICRAGAAARLPCARDERRTGGASDARKGQRLAPVVVPREERAYEGVLGAPEKASLTRDKVPIIFMQRGGYPTLQSSVNHMLRVSVSEALAIPFGAPTPFLRGLVSLSDPHPRCGPEDGFVAK